jgi:hypothetical protein
MSETHPQQPGQQPFLKLPEDLQPTYANLVRITHSASDMVFDFARLLPGDAAPEIQARVIMSPVSAKLFYRALAENLGRYETAFGEIHLPGDNSLLHQLFRPPQPPQPPEGK